MRPYVASTTFGLLLAAAAWADVAVNEKRLAEPNGNIDITIVSGTATVEVWDQNEIQVDGSLGKNTDVLEFSSENGRATMRVLPGKGVRSIGAATLRIKAPRTNRVKITTTSADITVSGVQGSTTLNTVSGDVHVTDVAGDANAESVSGDIVIQGNIRDARLKSVSGDIHAKTVSGEVKAETISGDIHIEGEGVKQFECDSTSGDAEFRGSLAPEAKVAANLHSGDLTLALAKDVSARIEATCFSGDISNALTGDRVLRAKYGPGSSFVATVGGGSALVELNTFSGDIKLLTR